MIACLRWLAVAGLLVAAQASAHTLSVSHLDIVVPASTDAPLEIDLDLAIRDIALTLPLDANRDERVTWGELKRVQGSLNQLITSGLRLSSAAGICALTPRGLATRRYDDGTYATIQLTAQCPSRDGLRVHYNLLFKLDPQHRALITLREADRVSTAIARADAQDISIGAASSHPFFDFLREGVHHILIGYDHLAFLLSLLLPSALIRRNRQWSPSPKLRDSFSHVLGIVTAFTVAHSLTLSLAALGWITPASRWIEVAIAASVLIAALNNVWPVVVNRIWLVAFSFGLIHGFGFAGALSELGLPTGARLSALVGFNLGVEIGQLLVVALVLPVLFFLRRRDWYVRFALPIASLLIAGLSAWWIYQRLR